MTNKQPLCLAEPMWSKQFLLTLYVPFCSAVRGCPRRCRSEVTGRRRCWRSRHRCPCGECRCHGVTRTRFHPYRNTDFPKPQLTFNYFAIESLYAEVVNCWLLESLMVTYRIIALCLCVVIFFSSTTLCGWGCSDLSCTPEFPFEWQWKWKPRWTENTLLWSAATRSATCMCYILASMLWSNW